MKKILIPILLCFALVSNAQTIDNKENKAANLTLSYSGSITYPGARCGIEVPMKTVELTKKQKVFIKDRLLTAQIGYYHHPSFHDNLYLTAGWTMRRTRPNGFFVQFSPEIGYSRTFLGGTTYTVNDNDNVSIKKMAGYNYLLMSLGGGLGYNFEKTKNLPIAVSLKANILAMAPYNSSFYLRPTVELGIIYKPKHLFNHNIKSKHIIK